MARSGQETPTIPERPRQDPWGHRSPRRFAVSPRQARAATADRIDNGKSWRRTASPPGPRS